MTKRDSQRQRVYDASRSIEKANVSKYAKYLDGTIEGSQRYVDLILAHSWFRRRWGATRLLVLDKHHGAATGGGGVIRLPRWARCEAVILHEITHNLISRTYASHGPEFVGVYTFLVGRVMGAETKKKLKSEYKRLKVKSNNRSLPTPTTNAPSMAALRKERVQNERRSLTDMERQKLAALLETAIRSGEFGPASSRSRNNARKIVKQMRGNFNLGKE